MASHAHIAFIFEDTRVYLAREFDGYPAVTGADLVFAVLGAPTLSPSECSDALLALHYAPHEFNSGKPVYERTLTVDPRAEWFYIVHFGDVTLPDSAVTFACVRRHVEQTADAVFEAARTADRVTLGEFVRLVNSDRRRISRRLLELRRAAPVAHTGIFRLPSLKIPE
jgi:hypothetical protein